MRKNPATCVLGLASVVIAVVLVVVLLIVVVVHAGAALSAPVRELFSQPLPPMTFGQALCTFGVLAVLLSFRR